MERKRVLFSPSIQVHPMRHANVKKEDLWYKQEHYKSFKEHIKRIRLVVHHQLRGGDPQSLLDSLDGDYCLTGLEDRITFDQILNRRKRILKYKRFVLEQQHARINTLEPINLAPFKPLPRLSQKHSEY